MSENKITKNTFEKLFNEYYNPLCNFVLGITKDKNKAEDVVQDVFVQMWKKRDSITIDKNLKSYLFAAAKNKAIEWLRRENLFKKFESSADGKKFLQGDTEDLSYKYEMLEKLNHSIRQLPTKCQKVFRLGKINGLTYAEIAEEMDISVKTVENQMSRALKLLRNMMFESKSDKL